MPRKSLTQADIDNFRISFCETAYALFKSKGYDAVTMRGIAKVLGCSPMMAYRYFENKEEVFAALRAIRFDSLAQALESAAIAGSPLANLRELGEAYADFAHDTPHAYRLLYMTPIDQQKTYPDLERAQLRTQNVLFEATRRVVESGDIEGDPVLLAHTFWASIHGLVSLDLLNQLNRGATFNDLFSTMLDHLIKRQ